MTSARFRDSYAYRLYQNAHPATNSSEPRMNETHTQYDTVCRHRHRSSSSTRSPEGSPLLVTSSATMPPPTPRLRESERPIKGASSFSPCVSPASSSLARPANPGEEGPAFSLVPSFSAGPDSRDATRSGSGAAGASGSRSSATSIISENDDAAAIETRPRTAARVTPRRSPREMQWARRGERRQFLAIIGTF